MTDATNDSGRRDLKRAEEIAHDRLLAELGEHHSGAFEELAEALRLIRADTRVGNVPELRDMRQAREALRALGDRLDDVDELHDRNPWDTGKQWGELTDEQKEEICERDEGAAGGVYSGP